MLLELELLTTLCSFIDENENEIKFACRRYEEKIRVTFRVFVQVFYLTENKVGVEIETAKVE